MLIRLFVFNVRLVVEVRVCNPVASVVILEVVIPELMRLRVVNVLAIGVNAALSIVAKFDSWKLRVVIDVVPLNALALIEFKVFSLKIRLAIVKPENALSVILVKPWLEIVKMLMLVAIIVPGATRLGKSF